MKRRIIISIVCISIILFGSINAIAANPISKSKQDEYFQQAYEVLEEENFTIPECAFLTFGPVSKFYSDVEITDGNPIEVNIIEKNLGRKLFRFGWFLPFVLIPIFNCNFTVQYTKALENTSKYSYLSYNGTAVFNEDGKVEDIINETIKINTPHKVKLVNFSGIFFFKSAEIYNRLMPWGHRLFTPAKFMFVGYCDNVTYYPVAI